MSLAFPESLPPPLTVQTTDATITTAAVQEATHRPRTCRRCRRCELIEVDGAHGDGSGLVQGFAEQGFSGGHRKAPRRTAAAAGYGAGSRAPSTSGS